MIKHTVKPLETLTKISKKYNVTVDEIVQANKDKITNKNVIRIGWVLNIPTPEDKKPTPAPVPETPANPPYKKIGRKVINCLEAIENTPEFKELMEMIANANRN